IIKYKDKAPGMKYPKKSNSEKGFLSILVLIITNYFLNITTVQPIRLLLFHATRYGLHKIGGIPCFWTDVADYTIRDFNEAVELFADNLCLGIQPEGFCNSQICGRHRPEHHVA